jgi:hypothetical protein
MADTATDNTFEIIRLKQLKAMAKQLGFWDDVAHHTAELKKLGVEE